MTTYHQAVVPVANLRLPPKGLLQVQLAGAAPRGDLPTFPQQLANCQQRAAHRPHHTSLPDEVLLAVGVLQKELIALHSPAGYRIPLGVGEVRDVAVSNVLAEVPQRLGHH